MTMFIPAFAMMIRRFVLGYYPEQFGVQSERFAACILVTMYIAELLYRLSNSNLLLLHHVASLGTIPLVQ